MKRMPIITIMILLLSSISPLTVSAQGETPHIVNSTRPISDELRGYLDAWLAADAPVAYPYYIVTYAKTKQTITYVSLVAVDLPSPDAEWSLEDGEQTMWMGSVTVDQDGTVHPFIQVAQANSLKVLANFSPAPPLAAGGGAYVAFPIQAGTGAIYGPRGVHGSGDYGTAGMLAVDLVSGDDLGADAAPPYVFASDAGTIDYVCDDGTSVAVRTHNASTGDYFLYAHMLDNDNLIVSTEFARGDEIGALKYGSFDPTDPNCGWAEQEEDHYHVHWMFTPSSGTFQAEGCILSTTTKKWTCGTSSVGTGGWIYGGGGVGVSGGTGDGLDWSGVSGSAGGTPAAERSFWDYVIIGLIAIFDRGLLKLLPEHNTWTYVYVVINTISMMLRIVRVLAYGNLSLAPLIAVVLYGIAINSVMSIVWLVSFLFKAWKSLVPILGA